MIQNVIMVICKCEGGINSMNKKFISILSVISLLLLTACGNKEQAKEKVGTEGSEDVLSVYTTVNSLQYFAERIGGDTVNVQSIYPPGADEHSFDPTQKDMFEGDFEELKKDLLDLDQKFKDMASNAAIKTFFVSHAAFGYTADTYGLEQVAVAGINSQSEPS